MSTMTDTPRIWIGCLASYNAGRLIGEWVDATDVEEMNRCQARVASDAIKAAKVAGEWPVYFGPPEEFHIADYDNFPANVVSKLGEYADYKRVAAVGKLIDEHGQQAHAWLSWTEDDLDGDDLEDRMNDQTVGTADSEEDYAIEYSMEMGVGGVHPHWPKPTTYGHSSTETINIIDELSSYIKWDSVADELFDHGTMSFVDGYIFDSER